MWTRWYEHPTPVINITWYFYVFIMLLEKEYRWLYDVDDMILFTWLLQSNCDDIFMFDGAMYCLYWLQCHVKEMLWIIKFLSSKWDDIFMLFLCFCCNYIDDNVIFMGCFESCDSFLHNGMIFWHLSSPFDEQLSWEGKRTADNHIAKMKKASALQKRTIRPIKMWNNPCCYHNQYH